MRYAAVVVIIGLLPGLAWAEGESAQVFVMEPQLTDLPASIGNTVSSAIGQAAQEEGVSVLTKADALEVLANQVDLGALGADASGLALAELGKAVGAKHLITTTVSQVGEETLIHMRLIDTSKGVVLARRELRTSDYAGDLVETVRIATRVTLAPIFGHLKGTLEISVSEEDANVLVDGDQVGVAPLEPFVQTGGHHVLTITKEGFIRHQEAIRIVGGDIVKRMVTLRPSAEFLAKYNSKSRKYRILAWISTTLAAPLIAGSVVLGLKKSDQDDTTVGLKDQYDALSPAEQQAQQTQFNNDIAKSTNKAQQYGNAALGLGIGAGVAALSAAYFWIFGDAPGRYAEFSEAP